MKDLITILGRGSRQSLGQARCQVIGGACSLTSSPEGVRADGGRAQRHGADELQASRATRGHVLGRRGKYFEKS